MSYVWHKSVKGKNNAFYIRVIQGEKNDVSIIYINVIFFFFKSNGALIKFYSQINFLLKKI